MSTARAIRNFVEHPFTRLTVGLVLFATGFAEAYESFTADFAEVSVGAHHGLMLFGFMNVLASIPDIVEGIGSGAHYLEHRAAKRRPSE